MDILSPSPDTGRRLSGWFENMRGGAVHPVFTGQGSIEQRVYKSISKTKKAASPPSNHRVPSYVAVLSTDQSYQFVGATFRSF